MKKFKALVVIAIIVILSFCLTGCVGKEPNEIAYIVAIGIDMMDEYDDYEITIQYANPTEISGGEEGGKAGSSIIENISVQAPNIYAAIGLANRIVSKTFYLSHTRIIVVSREVAQKGLQDITETFIRSDDLRPDIYLAVSLDGANKYLDSVKPAMEVNPAKYYQLIYDKNSFMGIPVGSAKDFFFGIETENFDSLLPVAGVIGNGTDNKSSGEGNGGGSSQEGGAPGGGESSEEGDISGSGGLSGGNSSSEGGASGGEGSSNGGASEEGGMSGAGVSEKGSGGSSDSSSDESSSDENSKQKEAPENEQGFEYKMKDYIGGQAAIELKNKSESMGSAIFNSDKMIGTIGSIESQMFKLLMGDYNYSYITVFSEQTPNEPVTVKTIQGKTPKYDIDIKKKSIDVKLFLEGDVSSLPADYNIENDIANFEDNASKYLAEGFAKFMSDFIKTCDSDIFRLKERCKYKFLTNDKYNEFKESVNFKEYSVNVNVDFKIRRTGLVMREEK
ncbi:MAG: hypothetical protein J1F01_00950 [Oscillospiraceae bacterium]|nr:hypothetical protein [Oscillospiraceae bacterium]